LIPKYIRIVSDYDRPGKAKSAIIRSSGAEEFLQARELTSWKRIIILHLGVISLFFQMLCRMIIASFADTSG